MPYRAMRLLFGFLKFQYHFFLTVLALSGCGEPGLLPSSVYRLLVDGGSLIAESRLQGVWSVTLCVWAFLRPGIKPVSLALAAGFLTRGLPGMSCCFINF